MNRMLKAMIGLSILCVLLFSCAISGDNAGDVKYVNRVKEIKESGLDQASKNAAIKDLQDELGIDSKSQSATVLNEALYKKDSTETTIKAVTRRLSSRQPGSASGGVKNKGYTTEKIFLRKVTINGGTTIEVEAFSNVTGVDTFLVLYTVTNGEYDDYTLEQELNILAYNDDFDGLNSKVTYTNPTRTPHDAIIMVFAYSENTTGEGGVYINNGGLADMLKIDVNGTSVTSTSYPRNIKDNTTLNPNNFMRNEAFTTYENGYWGKNNPDIHENWGADANGADTWIWVLNFTKMEGMSNDDAVSGVRASEISNCADLVMPGDNHRVVLGGFTAGGTVNRFVQVNSYSY